jgi:hypothetical protein
MNYTLCLDKNQQFLDIVATKQVPENNKKVKAT